MPTDHRAKLATIRRFDQLIAYLRNEMGWPIESGSSFEELTFEYLPDELGIDPKTAAKIQEIKRLRPLSPRQPWGIFFVKFEPKRLPVVALRRILGQVALKKRASANSAERAAWAADDLLFVSNYGDGDERQISFAHFAQAHDGQDLPTLKVLGWDGSDTALHLDAVARDLTTQLAWPDDEADAEAWRKRWRAAFNLGHREVVTTSRDLSIRLAGLARNIRDRITTALAIETDKGPLKQLLATFRSSLVHDLDDAGFADMYAQTIAYGLLSARIADPTKKSADDLALHMRTSPFLRELMETFLKVGGRKGQNGGPGLDFDELGVGEVSELLDAANMEAVVRDFGDKNRQEDPVMHFFEGFLEAYNKAIRKDRGVFYTPQPVVSYIVRSVHELLQSEFGLADGLADTTTWGEMLKRHPGLELPPLTDEPGEKRSICPDEPFVQILDPATGTATFLVEVIDVIHRTLAAKWKHQGLTDAQQRAAWNDYVPQHLLPRLHAFELMMAPYAIAHMKVGLKLAETGYRFGTEERARIYLTNALEPWLKQLPLIGFDALAHEAASVNEIKRHKRFTVVIGNPPYAGHSVNNHIPAIVDLVHDYKAGLPELDRPGQGKWLQDDYVKFIRLGEHILSAVSSGLLGYITNHSFLDNPTFKGMRRHLLASFPRISLTDLHGNSKKKERTEEGAVDENVFEIQQGVAIMVARRGAALPTVMAHDLTGTREMKYSWLANHSAATVGAQIRPAAPMYLFRAQDSTLSSEYGMGVPLPELMSQSGEPAPGFVTTHDEFAISWTASEAADKVERLLATKSEAEARNIFTLCSQNQWNYARAKSALRDGSWRKHVVKALYRPFDWRWTVWNPNVAVHRRERVMRHMLGRENLGLICTRQTKDQWGVLVTRNVAAHKTCGAYDINFLFPLYVVPESDELDMGRAGSRTSFSPSVIRRLGDVLGMQIEKQSGLPTGLAPEAMFHYAYAVFHSPGYRSRYAEFLKIDFPRLPLTGNLELFRALARLGGELTALHLLESPRLNQPITEFISGRNPEVEKVSWSRDTVWVDKAQSAGFRGVGEDVWKFHIGGYQVCEKWLKDRKGRSLSKDDIAHYHKIVVALSESIRLMKEIDEVIEQHGGWPGAFQGGEAKAEPATVLAFRPRTVEPKPADRYATCLPLIPLKAAAGAFSDPQRIQQKGWDDDFDWVAVESRHRLRQGMFVGQVVGKSMEPAIPDGSWCLFRAPVEGTRNGKIVLVQLRDAADPESGERYTVKRYKSEKSVEGDSWHHERITLKPVNHDFAPIVLAGRDAGELQVVAEVVEVLDLGAQAPTAPPQSGVGPQSVDSERLQQTEVESAPGTQRDGRPDPPGGDSRESPPPGPDFDADQFPCQIRSLFADGKPRDRESAIRELREQLGFKRTGHVLREALDNGIRTAVRRGILMSEGGVLKLHLASIDDFDRDFLKEQFMASLGGRAWRERAEAARVLARFLGFRRTGPAIEDAARSIINGLLREGRLEARASEIRRVD
jgi:hypothetical protein